MQYIQLADGLVVIHTSKGAKTITIESFNYVSILRNLNEGCSEDDILPLLETPKLVDGVYRLYCSNNTMMYRHYVTDDKGTTTCHIKDLAGNECDIPKTAELIGMYYSMDGILSDWPEYAI